MTLTSEDWVDIDIAASLQESSDSWKCRIDENSWEAKLAASNYLRFFRKTASALKHDQMSKHFATRAAKLNLEDIQQKLHTHEIPLNSSSDVVRQIRLLESSTADLDEALLKTYPTKHFLKKCQLFQQKVVPEDLQKMTQQDVDGEGSSSQRYIDGIETTDFDSKTGVAAIVYVPLLAYEEDLRDLEENIDQLKEAARFMGYFMVQCESVHPRNPKAVQQGIVAVQMAFEAKYSKTDFDMPEFLCHLTLPQNLSSIAKKGLKPKSNSDVFAYPDRIYFFGWESNAYKQLYGALELLKGNPGQIAVIRVRSKALERYGPFASGKMKFFIDPKIGNLDDEQKPRAIYTYEPVPLMLLEDDVELLSLDASGNATERESISLASDRFKQ